MNNRVGKHLTVRRDGFDNGIKLRRCLDPRYGYLVKRCARERLASGAVLPGRNFSAPSSTPAFPLTVKLSEPARTNSSISSVEHVGRQRTGHRIACEFDMKRIAPKRHRRAAVRWPGLMTMRAGF